MILTGTDLDKAIAANVAAMAAVPDGHWLADDGFLYYRSPAFRALDRRGESKPMGVKRMWHDNADSIRCQLPWPDDACLSVIEIRPAVLATAMRNGQRLALVSVPRDGVEPTALWATALGNLWLAVWTDADEEADACP